MVGPTVVRTVVVVGPTVVSSSEEGVVVVCSNKAGITSRNKYNKVIFCQAASLARES